ncbi:MAG: hypothetical protein HOO87_13235, partial [Methyloglobulus sp.]|nr:hypothetical protein [Methyloglobulus sp.]
MIKKLFPIMLLGFALSSQAMGTSYTYKIIDPPAGSIDILPNRMNNNGQVVGTYIDSTNKWHGFVYSNGVFTSIDVPDAGYTNVKDINNNGQLIGEYSNSTYGHTHGFLNKNGVFTTIDLPDYQSTALKAINDSGQILGYG